MEKRLDIFLKAKNISQSRFADSINVAKASVSHILSGRNKPGFDFIESMARQYPDLSLDWLITGKGEMLRSMGTENPQSPGPSPAIGGTARPQELDLFPDKDESTDHQDVGLPSQSSLQKPPRISRILVFYDNGTFKELG